jgi:hypothetical protein
VTGKERLTRHLLWTAASALALTPCLVRADPLLTFGPDVPLYISASESVRRDSNVDLAPTNAEADTIFLFVPGIEVHWTGSEASLSISASEQFSRYAKVHELDDHLADLAAAYSFAGQALSLSASGGFVQQDQNNLTSASADQTARHSTGNALANAELAFGPNTKLGIGSGFNRTTYAQIGYVGTDVWSFPVDLYYGITPKTDVSVGYRADITRTDSGVGNADSNFFNIGARGAFTPKLSGQVRVGVTELRPEGAPDSNDLGLNAALEYQATSNTKMDFTAGSGYTTSPVGTNERVFSLGLSAVTQLSQSFSASFGGSYDSTEYLYALARKDGFWVGNIGLNYTWTRSTGFQLSYLFRKNDSTLDAAVFSDNVLTLSAASKF